MQISPQSTKLAPVDENQNQRTQYIHTSTAMLIINMQTTNHNAKLLGYKVSATQNPRKARKLAPVNNISNQSTQYVTIHIYCCAGCCWWTCKQWIATTKHWNGNRTCRSTRQAHRPRSQCYPRPGIKRHWTGSEQRKQVNCIRQWRKRRKSLQVKEILIHSW